MKRIKKFFYICSFFLIAFSLQSSEPKEPNNFDFSLFNNDDDISEIMHVDPQHATRFPKINTLEVITSLNLQKALQTELYQRTHAPLSRPPIDLSILQIMTIYDSEFKVTPFISSMWKQNYTTTSSHIDSYINLKLHDIMEILDENEFTTIEVPEVLELFHPLKMQEHTAGFMFQGIKTYENGWAFTFSVPLQYTLNNFHLTQEEKERIDNYPLFAEFNGNVMDFARKHLISDRLGIGDTQVTAEYCLADTYRTFQSLGLTVTIPTAFAFKNGLYGTYFNRDEQGHPLNLYSDLINPWLEYLSTGNEANVELIQNNAEQFGLSALNRLSTLLIQRHMGNDYHWALGFCYRSTINFTDNLSWISKMNFEVQMPSVLQRFFLIQATPEEFNAFDWANNNVEINEKINFLNLQFANMFFPKMFYATVFPGVLFHSTSCLKKYMAAGKWAPMIGFDSWFHTPEHFMSINAPKTVLSHVNLDIARRRKAWSSSIWIGIERPPLSTSTWTLALKAYGSLLNAGFGDAYGVAFTFEKDF